MLHGYHGGVVDLISRRGCQIGMAKASRDLILRDRLQFDINASGDTALVYGRIDMSDFVNVVKRDGFAVKEVRYQIRDPTTTTGVLDPLLTASAGTFANIKLFTTTTAYENANDVGIASPDVLSVFELTTAVQLVSTAQGEGVAFQNQWTLFGTPDLHPEGYNIVSDLLIGVSADNVLAHADTTLEIDVMVIGEAVKLSEADMTEMIQQGQDL